MRREKMRERDRRTEGEDEKEYIFMFVFRLKAEAGVVLAVLVAKWAVLGLCSVAEGSLAY